MIELVYHRALLAMMTAGLVLAAGCAATEQKSAAKSTDKESVIGVTWEWTETFTPDHRIQVSQPDRYTIRLKPNGEAQIRYDCNHGGSFYEIADGKLSFGPLTATRIPCQEGSQGPMYMNQLAFVKAFFTKNGFLFLELPDEGTMRFRRADGG